MDVALAVVAGFGPDAEAGVELVVDVLAGAAAEAEIAALARVVGSVRDVVAAVAEFLSERPQVGVEECVGEHFVSDADDGFVVVARVVLVAGLGVARAAGALAPVAVALVGDYFLAELTVADYG